MPVGEGMRDCTLNRGSVDGEGSVKGEGRDRGVEQGIKGIRVYGYKVKGCFKWWEVVLGDWCMQHRLGKNSTGCGKENEVDGIGRWEGVYGV